MSNGLVFTFGADQVVFYIVYLAWLLSEIIGATIVPRLRYGARGGVKRDRGSFYLNIITLFVAISIDFVISGAGIAPLPDWAYYLGIGLMIIGLVLRQWAVAVLGRYFTLTVKVQSGHKVVEEGPYRLIRHPSYTGLLLMVIGIALALQSWAALLINVVVFGIVFGYRIRVEEKALVSEVGDDYISYSKRTKRLIPFVF